jgi:hypothetical protein
MSDFDQGPCMQRLTRKQRAFVLAHASDPHGSQAAWAATAGYSPGNGGGNCGVIAVSLMRNPKVVDAMFEVARLAFRAKGPAIAADALLKISQTVGHKDQARASIAILDRCGMGPIQSINVEHLHHHDLSEGEMIERVKELAVRCGLDAQKLLGVNNAIVEADYEVVNGGLPARSEATLGFPCPAGTPTGDRNRHMSDDSKVGVVQTTYPEQHFGFISAGREGGAAVHFDFSSVIGPAVMVGDKVRVEIRGDRAVNVQLIPK